MQVCLRLNISWWMQQDCISFQLSACSCVAFAVNSYASWPSVNNLCGSLCCRLWEEGWKQRYYKNKFDVDVMDEDFRRKVVQSYVEGLCWVLRYYYQVSSSVGVYGSLSAQPMWTQNQGFVWRSIKHLPCY